MGYYRRLEGNLDAKQEANFAKHLINYSIKLEERNDDDFLEESVDAHNEALALVAGMKDEEVSVSLSKILNARAKPVQQMKKKTS